MIVFFDLVVGTGSLEYGCRLGFLDNMVKHGSGISVPVYTDFVCFILVHLFLIIICVVKIYATVDQILIKSEN